MTTATLTPQEKQTLRTAAYGAVTLVSVAYPGPIATTKTNVVGSMVLTGATGLVGTALAGKGDAKLPKGTAGDIADVVLPALRESVALLTEKDPEEADGFRRIVLAAVEQGASSSGGGINPAQAEMISKVKAAMG
jgi:hypothetical protein